MLNPEGITIRDEKDVERIVHSSEQEFARLLLQNPHLQIGHEQDVYTANREITKPDGSIETVTVGHVPDFLIINTKNPHAGPIHVEITQHDYDPAIDPPELDPKAKQRYVMQQREKSGRYVVLYLSHLDRIERARGVTIVDFSLRERMAAENAKESPIAS